MLSSETVSEKLDTIRKISSVFCDPDVEILNYKSSSSLNTENEGETLPRLKSDQTLQTLTISAKTFEPIEFINSNSHSNVSIGVRILD